MYFLQEKHIYRFQPFFDIEYIAMQAIDKSPSQEEGSPAGCSSPSDDDNWDEDDNSDLDDFEDKVPLIFVLLGEATSFWELCRMC